MATEKKKFKKQNVLGFMTETVKLDDDSLIKNNISVLPELEPYIFPLTKQEFNQLESNIIAEGCRDPLVIWKKGDMDFVLVDGHNRYKICSKHELDFKVEKKHFESISAIKDWMINNQLGRRNLTPEQSAILRGRLYNRIKKVSSTKRDPKGQFVPSVNSSEKLASAHKVSEKTIKRDGLYADGMETIKKANQILYNDILSRKEKVKRADIEKLGKASRTDEKLANKLKLKSVSDIGKVITKTTVSQSEDKENKLAYNKEKLVLHARQLKAMGMTKNELQKLIDQLY